MREGKGSCEPKGRGKKTAIPANAGTAVQHLYLQAPMALIVGPVYRPEKSIIVFVPIIVILGAGIPEAIATMLIGPADTADRAIQPPTALPHDHRAEPQTAPPQVPVVMPVIESASVEVDRHRTVSMTLPPAMRPTARHLNSTHVEVPWCVAVSPGQVIAVGVGPVTDYHMPAYWTSPHDQVSGNALPLGRAWGCA
jgi:hypothetical protein